MSIGATGRGYANRARSLGTAKLLSGVGAAALVIAASLASPAVAEIYHVSTAGELRDYIIFANGDGDPSSTIVMDADFGVDATGLPGATKPLTIDTNGHTLSTAGNNGITLQSGSGPTTLQGTITGANISAPSASAVVNIRGVTSLINYATIQGGTNSAGTGVAGADLGGPPGGPATLVNHGIIRGGNGSTVGGVGLSVRNGVNPIVNTGTIEGGTGALAITTNSGTIALRIINSGTIRAGGGQATAIGWGTTPLTTGTLTLELQEGSEIFGNVVANAAAAGDTLRLGGDEDDTFDASEIGPKYQNFNIFEKTGTSTWTLTGTTTATTPWQLLGGTLAVSSDGALGDAAGALTFNGGALRALASFATNRAMSFTSIGGIDVVAGAVLTVNGPMTGVGGLVKLGEGTLLQHSVTGHLGGTFVWAGTLQAGAANLFAGNYVTDGEGTLDLGGFDQTILNYTGAGRLRLGSTPGTTLTISEDFIGNGGVVEMNVALGDDTSEHDLLLVNGATSGTSSLVVTNVGGAGAQTGTAGIKVIDVGGTSTGTFALIGDYVFEGDQAVVGGAYAYRLYQGTETTADGDWYLRSEIIDAGPLYAPTVPLYENYGNVLQGFNELGTLQQRVGGREWLNGGQAAGGDDGAIAPDAIWARMDASQAHFKPGVSTTGASYDVSTWRLQAGLDGVLNQGEAGSLVAGVNAQFGTVSSDITSMYGAGSIDAMGFGVGGTLTWYGAGGLYVDGQAQATWYSADIASDDTGTTLVEGNDAFGYGLSIEAGQKIGLDDNWSLTPQAQLSYSAVRFNDFTDQYDGTVSLSDGGDMLVGRLGLSADYEGEWQDANGETKLTHLYGVANLYYDFLDGTSVDVSGTEFTSENQGLWGGVGIGGSLSWADEQYSVFGEALVRGSVDDFGGNNALGAKVGFNAKW